MPDPKLEVQPDQSLINQRSLSQVDTIGKCLKIQLLLPGLRPNILCVRATYIQRTVLDSCLTLIKKVRTQELNHSEVVLLTCM